MLAGLNRTLDKWLCDSFVELLEEMELWKWDDATGDFWSRLAKALKQSNISITWAEQLDSRLASVHTTGKMSWAAATRYIRECITSPQLFNVFINPLFWMLKAIAESGYQP